MDSLRYLRGFCRDLGIRLRDRVYSSVRAAYVHFGGISLQDLHSALLGNSLDLLDYLPFCLGRNENRYVRA